MPETDPSQRVNQNQGLATRVLLAQSFGRIDVQILEAFAYIGRPLSERDLFAVFDGKVPMPNIRAEVRRLFKCNAIEIAGNPAPAEGPGPTTPPD